MIEIDKEFDDNQRKEILEEVSETVSLNNRLISEIQEIGRTTNIDVDINNAGIILNNKIIELSHEFYKAGISISSSKRET